MLLFRIISWIFIGDGLIEKFDGRAATWRPSYPSKLGVIMYLWYYDKLMTARHTCLLLGAGICLGQASV